MKFEYKCLLQRFFSSVPKGELLNYQFQKHITKSLPPKNEKFLGKVNTAHIHYNNFLEHNKLAVKSNKYYEFGAGWTLTIPLAMTFLNFEVFCVDINKLVISDLILDSLSKFKQNKDQIPFKIDNDIELKDKNLIKELAQKYKLNYFAPKDARNTGFEENSFDFISSSVTMEHIPKDDILSILNECYRLLNKGGILSMTIDYQDHWSYFDKSISCYNFLKYSEKEWKKYNPSLHYQNRMRHKEYLDIISKTNFKVVKEVPQLPVDKNIKELASLKVAKEFEHFSFDELAIKGSEIVLIK